MGNFGCLWDAVKSCDLSLGFFEEYGVIGWEVGIVRFYGSFIEGSGKWETGVGYLFRIFSWLISDCDFYIF